MLVGVARQRENVNSVGAAFEPGGVFDRRAEAVRCLGLFSLLEARGAAGADALACLRAAAAEEVPAVAAVAVAALADAALLWCAARRVLADGNCSLVPTQPRSGQEPQPGRPPGPTDPAIPLLADRVLETHCVDAAFSLASIAVL